MTNQAAQTMPELPEPFDTVRVNDFSLQEAPVFSAGQMREMYQRGLAARPLPSDWVADGLRGEVTGVMHGGFATISVDCSHLGPHILSKGDTFTLLNDKAKAAPSAPAEGGVSPGDAVFAFSAMLTSLPHVIPLGGAAWATPGADLAAAFNEANGLSVSRDFPESLKFPEIEGKLLEVVKRASEEIKTAPEPLAQGGGREAVDRDAWAEALELPQGYTVDEFLPGGWHYAWTRADGERMVSGTTWNHPALAAIAAWQYASDTPPQPSASVSERDG